MYLLRLLAEHKLEPEEARHAANNGEISGPFEQALQF